MSVDEERIDEAVLALLWPTLHDARRVRIDIVQAGCREQRRNRRPGAAAVRSGKGSILAGQGLRADGALDGVGIDLEPAVMEAARQGRAVAQGVADRDGELGTSRDAARLALSPWSKSGDDRHRLRLPCDRECDLGADCVLEPVPGCLRRVSGWRVAGGRSMPMPSPLSV
jgi:hypothetical protein